MIAVPNDNPAIIQHFEVMYRQGLRKHGLVLLRRVVEEAEIVCFLDGEELLNARVVVRLQPEVLRLRRLVEWLGHLLFGVACHHFHERLLSGLPLLVTRVEQEAC